MASSIRVFVTVAGLASAANGIEGLGEGDQESVEFAVSLKQK